MVFISSAVAIVTRVFEIYYSEIERSWESEWFVARDSDSKALGVGRFISDYARYAFIVDVIVLEKHHGKGIGTALMNEIIMACRGLEVDSVNLWPSKGKVPFYEKLGFYALPSDQPHMKLGSKK
jgi:GNAT superfamily N-acetyltransferase